MQLSQKATKTFETQLSRMWFEESGLFCSVTKPNCSITKDALTLTFNFIKENVGDKKICWLSNVTEAAFPTDEARDFAGEETPRIIRALALITNSQISRLIANVFITLKKPPYPTKMFSNEQDAREWIGQYL